MAGISPKLPLTRDVTDGFYMMNKTHAEVVRQNLKSLILTSPGERVMEPEFGVGIRHFLFEHDNAAVQGDITSKIREQVNIYMPFVEILNVSFNSFSSTRDIDFDPNQLGVSIEYKIIPLDADYALEVIL
tara:strand:+ start:242 stop:631 length:390 start_codon:yes stop_codon:yes gene_type:complete